MFARPRPIAHAFARAALLLLVSTAVSAPSRAEDTSARDVSRIVSVGGDVTEILYELGLGDNVVAIDTTSVFPAQIPAEKKSVGYMRALASEGVLAVGPTLVLATDKAGPPEVVAALKASSTPFITIEGADTPEGVADKVAQVASIVGKEEAGQTLAARIRAEFESAADARKTITKPVKALFFLSVQSGRALAGGKNTAADAMLALAGAENVVSSFDGYKPLSGEAALALAPEAIIVMKAAPGHRTTEADSPIATEIAAIAGLASTPAVKNGRIIEFDGSPMLQFGPRAAQAARELMHLLYPDIVPARRIN